MTAQLSALAIFIAVFAIAAVRGVHLGIMMFAAATGTGVWLAGIPLRDVVRGFPLNIMVLLVGVTYFAAELVAVEDDAIASVPLNRNQQATVVCMIGLITAVLGTAAAGLDPDIGVCSFVRRPAGIDRSGGWQGCSLAHRLAHGPARRWHRHLRRGAADDGYRRSARPGRRPHRRAAPGQPGHLYDRRTRVGVCLDDRHSRRDRPLAVPIVAGGNVSGWALISALAVCAALVDVSPFSTTGATLIASAHEDERARMASILTRWGLGMVVIGPVVLVGTLVFFSRPG